VLPETKSKKRLVLLGEELVFQGLLARLLGSHIGHEVEFWRLSDLSIAQETPDLFMIHTDRAELLQEVRRRFPGAQIIARVPGDRDELWSLDYADVVIDHLADFSIILQAIESCENEGRSKGGLFGR
jgi:hypothetical protein